METKLTLVQIATEVSNLTQFEKKVEELEYIVKKSKATINFTDPTHEQIELVRAKRVELRKVEKDIEDTGMDYRRMFTKINSEISKKQKELTAITTPEIERLKEIEAVAKKQEELRQRNILLPERKRRLDAISDKFPVDYSEEQLLDMDSPTFEEFYNSCVSSENERVRLELETKRIADQEKIDEENAKKEKEIADQKAQIDADRQKIADEQNAKQKMIDDKMKVQQDKIDEANREIEAERVRLAHQKEMQEVQTKERIKAEEDAKKKQEEEDNAKRANIELAESRKKFQLFRKNLGWTEKTKDEFETRVVKGGYELWRNLGKFIK